MYSTYLGGSGEEQGLSVAVDPANNAYIAGYTTSDNFPTANAFQSTLSTGVRVDAFVSKLNSDGTALVYSTYLGGSDEDLGLGIDVDAAGHAYTTGRTKSTDFPLALPFQDTHAGGTDTFVTKFSPTGEALVYSTYLGGSGDDEAWGVAVGPYGQAYVSGLTTSVDFPLEDALQDTIAGSLDIFVTKLDEEGESLGYSTYIGGEGTDAPCCRAIDVDVFGNAYIVSSTNSAFFPTEDAFQPNLAGGADAIIAKIIDTPSFEEACDVDRDGDVDPVDLDMIFAGREMDVPDGHPLDINRDTAVTVNDVRLCVLLCTGTQCQPISNAPPSAKDDTYEINKNTTLSIDAPGILDGDTDGDGNGLTVKLVTGPAYGSLTLKDDGSFTYAPNLNFDGTDSFTYKAHDGTVNSDNIATVTITVLNHPPNFTSTPITTGNVGALYTYQATASDIDPGEVLTFSLLEFPDGMTIDSVSGLIEWTPTQPGDYDVKVQVQDTGLLSPKPQMFPIEVSEFSRDLTISEVEPSQLVFDGQAMTVSGNISATISNLGTDAVPAPFEALFFEDVDYDNGFTAGTDNILGSMAITSSLAAGASMPVSTLLSGTVQFPGVPIWGFVDSTNLIAEANEDNNLARSVLECEFVPPVGQFNPVVEFVKDSFDTFPESNGVLMTPAVVDLDLDSFPEIVFLTSTFQSGQAAFDTLRAISGVDGSEVWAVRHPGINPAAGVAVGDIDLDGYPEIIASLSNPPNKLVAFEHDGTFKWESDQVWGNVGLGSASIANLDQKGSPEIIIGANALDNKGKLLWRGDTDGGEGIGENSSASIQGSGPLSIVADLDLDGSPEVVAGKSAYRANGDLYWNANIGSDGFPAVGNFDADPFPEIVLVSTGHVLLLEHTGEVIWATSVPFEGRGGAPTVADVDGDGEPEIGVAGATRYSVYETDGSLKWDTLIQDGSSHVTGSSVFDFEGDGSAEIIYGDELFLRIYRGSDGMELFKLPKGSGTAYELPVIADVDADGNAEIIAAANNVPFGNEKGIFVIGDANDTWVGTRKIWNQHAYHITNVNDDGTIPAIEANSWEVHNTYRLNAQPSSNPHAAPDLIPSYVSYSLDSSELTFSARIGNRGGVVVGPNINVAFYDGDPRASGVLLGVTQTSMHLESGMFEDISLTISSRKVDDLWVVADDDGASNGQVNECDEENNFYQSGINIVIPSAPPTIISSPIATGVDCQLYSYDVEATDPDTGDVLSFSLDVAPAGMTVDPATGLIEWTPDATQVGDNDVTVRVEDTGGQFDTQSFTISTALFEFEEDFESYAEGSELDGQGGWTTNGSPLIVSTGGGIGSKVGNGRIVSQAGDFSLSLRELPASAPLDPTQVYSVSFDAFAHSMSPELSHNSGVFLYDEAGVHVVGWFAENNSNTPTPNVSWVFTLGDCAEVIAGGFDNIVSLEIVLDPEKQQTFGRADFGAGVVETAPCPMPPDAFAAIAQVGILQDFRFTGSNFLGVEIDNIKATCSEGDDTGTSNQPPVAVAGLLGNPNLPACVPPPDDLIFWWPGDGDNSDLVSGVAPIQILGDPQFTPAKVGQGVEFDGNDGLVIADDPDLDFGADESFTLDVWVRVDGLGEESVGNDAILDKFHSPPVTLVGYVLSAYHPPFAPPGHHRFNFVFRDIDSTSIDIGTNAIPNTDDEFHFVAVVVDRTAQTLSMYLDGVLQQELSIDHIGDTSNDANFFIGHHILPCCIKPFAGVADEIEVINRALSAEEIQALFLAGSSGKCKIRVDETVSLDGTRSFDSDGDPLTYRWELISVPAGSAATLDDPMSVSPAFVVDLPGTYVAQLITNDGLGDSNPATVSVTVIDANRPPFALDDSYNVNVDDSLTVNPPGVMANDLDIDGNPLTPLLIDPPSAGTLDFQSDGSFTYTPDLGVHGPGQTAHTIIATIHTGGAPNAVAINPGTNRIYTADVFDNMISVVDGSTDTIAARIQGSIANPTGYVENVAVNPVSNRVYVSGTRISNHVTNTPVHTNRVTVIDGETNAILTSIPVGSQPDDLAVNPITNMIYVANVADNRVSVINGNTNLVDKTVAVGRAPPQIGINSVTDRIYVLSTLDNNVTVIDGTANDFVTAIDVGSEPLFLAVDTDLNRVYVANSASNNVSVIDGADDTVIDTIDVGTAPQAIGINPTTGLLYVTNFDDDTVSVIDRNTRQVVDTINLDADAGPQSITVNPLSNRVYVANLTDATVSVINGDTDQVTATVPVGAKPMAIAVNPETDRVYTAHFGAHTVSVIHVGDHFTYKVNDNAPGGALDSNIAKVTIVIEGDQVELITVPNVIDLPQADAEAAIVAAGLTVAAVTTAHNDTIAEGNVISQNPVGGTKVSAQTAVQLVVSLGLPPAPNAPTITSDPVLTAIANQLYTYDVEATGMDGDDLTFSFEKDAADEPIAPDGMTIDPLTGLIQWTPGPSDVGEHDVEVRVEDTAGLFDTQPFSILVADETQIAVPDVIGLPRQDAIDAITAATLNPIPQDGKNVELKFDSLPGAQGWDYVPVGNAATETEVFSVSGGILRQDTIGLDLVDVGANLYLFSDGIGDDEPFTLTATARVEEEEGGPAIGGFALAVIAGGEEFVIGLGKDVVADADGNVLTGEVDTSEFHEYRLEGIPGDSFQLFVDDVLIASGTPRLTTQSNRLILGDISGQTNAEAEVSSFSFVQGRGLVFDQDPDPNTPASENSDVDLFIAEERANVPVPDVIRLLQAPAFDDILNAGLSVGVISLDHTSERPVGEVLLQNLIPGTSVPEKTAMNLSVSGGVLVPNIVGLPQAQAPPIILAANLKVGTQQVVLAPSVTPGLVANQNPDAGTPVPVSATVDFDISGVSVPDVLRQDQADAEQAIQNAGLAVGALTLQLSTTVPFGQVISQQPDPNTVVSVGTPVNLTISNGSVPPSPLESIFIQQENPSILAGTPQTFKAIGILENKTSRDVTGEATWESSDSTIATIDASDPFCGQEGLTTKGVACGLKDGTTTISATVNGFTASTTLTVVATATGSVDPTIDITSPANNDTIIEPTNIIGTATDDNFFKYVLDFAPVGVVDENAFIIIAESTTPVVDGVLGTLDPTLLINDLYNVRLKVFDTSAGYVQINRTYQVDRQQKVGNFTLAFEDLNVPVAGIPITVIRTYDSRDKRKGDFGVGWRLDVKSMRFRVDGQHGTKWHVSRFGGTRERLFTLEPTGAHKISLTLPDGKVEEFDLTPQPDFQRFFPIFGVTAVYTPRPDTLGTLVPVGEDLLDVKGAQPGPVDLVRQNDGQPFDPQTFIYTTPDGRVFTIDRDEGVQQIRDLNGNTVTFGPNGITHSSGKGITFDRDGKGRITRITDPRGNFQEYTYDVNGDLIAHLDAERNETKFFYDFRHNLIELEDPRGISPVKNEYDDNGRLIKHTDAKGNTIEYTHNIGARQEIVKDRRGNLTVFNYDEAGNVLSQTDALGSTTTFTYDERGNLLTTIDPLGQKKTFTYDENNNLTSEQDALGNTIQYAHNPNGRLETIADASGNETTFNYDSKGNPLSVKDANNIALQEFNFDGSGNLTQINTLDGTTALAYDVFGNVSHQNGPGNLDLSFSHDANGNRLTQTAIRVVDGTVREEKTSFSYDKNNNLLSTTDPLGGVTAFSYNEAGQTESETDQRGHTIQFTYDQSGNLIRKDLPDGTSELFVYDQENRKTAETDPAGRTTLFTYDVRGNLIETKYPDGSATQNSYDAQNNLISITNEQGVTSIIGLHPLIETQR